MSPRDCCYFFAKGFILIPSSAFFRHLALFFFESVVGRGQGMHPMAHSEVSFGAEVHGTNLTLLQSLSAPETEAA